MNEDKQYIVIKHGHADTLSERVSQAMDQGYMPWGDLFYNEYKEVYVQAMVKTMNYSTIMKTSTIGGTQ